MLFRLPVPMAAGAVVSTMYLVIDITTNRNLFIPKAWQIAMAGAMTVVSLLMMSRVYTAFFVIVRHCDRHYGFPAYIVDLFNYRSLIFFFFLMAGYFTHTSRPGQWLDLSRTGRLLPPYLFWTLISLLALQPLMHLEQVCRGDWSWLTPLMALKEAGLHSWCYCGTTATCRSGSRARSSCWHW